MTKRERVAAAIAHQNTDFVPYSIGLTSAAHERLVAYTVDPGYVERMGDHMAGCGYGSNEETSPGSGRWRDEFGVVWNRTVDRDIGVVEGHIIPDAELGGWKAPEIDEKRLRANCEAGIERSGEKYSIMNVGFSLFERAWTLHGMESLLTDMITDPDFVHELLDAICEYNLKIIDIANEYPFDGFLFGDDWGQQSGTIMGPRYWKTFIKPRFARMIEHAKRTGKTASLHSCGDIEELFPDLIEIGLDMYQTFQPEIYDMRKVKREFGGSLAFWGGISTQRLLPFATPEEVKRVTRETIDIMSVNGGYLAGPTHAVPGDVPPENIVAMLEVFGERE